jgi:MerR family transcriptional regulator, thiopeptide resistance regulator
MAFREAGGLYRVHEFAERAGVTVKALHHYDRLGLLKPRRTDAGYRIYIDSDLERLEQIVALKFIGLSLKQIKAILGRNALQLPAALRLQRTELEEKRRLLDRAIQAIVSAESTLQSGAADALKKIIEVIEMQTTTGFMKNYYREEAWARFQERHPVWPSEAWSDLFRDVAAALTEDPAGGKAQELAARWRALRVSDAAGDPHIHAGLIKAWADREYWPEAIQKHFAEFDLHAISAFIAKAFGCYRRRNYDDLPLARQLERFTPKEREQLLLAPAGLYLTAAELSYEDPAGEKAQAIAALWMELMESKTGYKTPASKDYEAMVKRIQRWPTALVHELAALDREKIGSFILRAMAQPMAGR